MSHLAPWYYRNVVDPNVGPISRLVVRQIKGLGEIPSWEALAYLHPNVQPPTQSDKRHVIYGNADGTGTSGSRSQACHKAISEALERWAWMSVKHEDKSIHMFGLDIDPTTSGFAAWPGPFTGQVRKNAYYEAAERWSLAAWWMGGLSHRVIPGTSNSIEAIEILTPCVHAIVVLLHGKTDYGDHVYGFAGDSSITRAMMKAKVEYDRNASVLTRWKSDMAAVIPQKLLERRLVYFASEDGYRRFAERLNQRNLKEISSPPPAIVDKLIAGGWDRYCRVWRVLFEPAVLDDGAIDFFLF